MTQYSYNWLDSTQSSRFSLQKIASCRDETRQTEKISKTSNCVRGMHVQAMDEWQARYGSCINCYDQNYGGRFGFGTRNGHGSVLYRRDYNSQSYVTKAVRLFDYGTNYVFLHPIKHLKNADCYNIKYILNCL